MTSHPNLSNPPITEALLDIRIKRDDALTLEELSGFAELVAEEYPDRRERRQLHAEFAMGGETPSVTPASTTVGHIFWNEDKSRAVQARLDGFTINHVKKYRDWKALRADAQSLWKHYVAVAAPTRVVRCAVRFINRLEFAPGVDLGEPLRTRPEVAADLPQLLDEYFMRLVIPFDEGRTAAIIQATRNDPATEDRVVVLDIDVFVKRHFEPDSPELWQEFEMLRNIKNDCFFKSLQKETWEKFR